MRRLIPVLVLSLAAFFSSRTAAAQPTAGTVFVAGSGMASLRWAPTANDLATTASGAVAGGGFGIGVHLTPRLSARAEWVLSGRLEDTSESPAFPTEPYPPFIGSTDLQGALASGVWSALTTSLRVPSNYTERREAQAGFALLGYHLSAGRASIELLGGLGLVHERVTQITEVSLAIFPPQPPYRSEFVSGRHSAVPVVGVDAAVSLTEHVALVPQVRAYVLEGALNVRPGVGLRWTF